MKSNIIKPDNNYWSDSYDTDKWDMAQEAFKTWYYSKSQGIEPTPPVVHCTDGDVSI